VFKHVSGKIRRKSLAHTWEKARMKPYGEFLQRETTILSITLLSFSKLFFFINVMQLAMVCFSKI
jgi:hypothetical protein